MHTSDYVDEHGRHYVVHHNGDYSGDVLIRRTDAYGDGETVDDDLVVLELTVPMEVLFALVGDAVRHRLIVELEDASGTEVLESLGSLGLQRKLP